MTAKWYVPIAAGAIGNEVTMLDIIVSPKACSNVNTIPIAFNDKVTYATKLIHSNIDQLHKRTLFSDTNLYPETKLVNDGNVTSNLLDKLCRPKIINELRKDIAITVTIN